METAGGTVTVLTFEASLTLLRADLLELRKGSGMQPTARVRVRRADLAGISDLHADVDILSVQRSVAERLMRGTVYTVTEIDLDTVELDLRSWPDLLDDVGTPGILVENAKRPDLMWSVLMTSGIDADSLAVEGKDGLPEEEFQVIVPTYGVKFGHPVLFGGVRLLPPSSGPPMTVPPEFEHLAEPFVICSGIAIVDVVARTMFEAEQQGLAEIDLALGAALLAHRGGGADLTDQASFPFSRERTLAVLGRYPVVAVKGRWGRQWLRDTHAGRPETHGLAAFVAEHSPLGTYTYDNVSPRLKQAIASWRRAVDEVDRVAALLALWESVEFYVSGTRIPRRFAKAEIARIRERAVADLDPVLGERVARAINELNSPSVMERLEQAAVFDRVALTIGDLTVLRRLRDVRNKIVHGRASVVPAPADLRKGLSTASRLLQGRLKKEVGTSPINKPSDGVRVSPDESEHPRVRSSTFTREDKRWAQQATEAMMLMLPYVEVRELVPGRVQLRIRDLWSDATEESLVIGHMRACDVAIKHLAGHFFDGSLREAGASILKTLALLRADDLADLGQPAYDDGGRGIRLMVDAMVKHGPIDFPDDFRSAERLIPAYSVVLLALLFELAQRYEISPTRAAGNLGQEISTINPRD